MPRTHEDPAPQDESDEREGFETLSPEDFRLCEACAARLALHLSAAEGPSELSDATEEAVLSAGQSFLDQLAEGKVKLPRVPIPRPQFDPRIEEAFKPIL